MRGLLLLPVLLALGAGACQNTPPHRPDDLQVRYSTPAGEVPLNDYCDLNFRFEGPEVVALEVDADMPAHRHGMITHPEVMQAEDGSWWARGMIFHMPGAWVIELEARTMEGPRSLEIPLTIGPVR
ncbi:MAG: hypothetical protein ACYTF3_02615 [Planctomycetota bacterium]|jgi:hypothetical protein